MQSLSVSRQVKPLLFLPFFYLVQTRMRSLRGFFFNAATAWVPALILIWQWGGGSPSEILIGFAASYVSFISIYEVGYLVNDTYGTRRDETPRRRLTVKMSALDLVLFVVVRLLIWFGLAFYFGWTAQPMWAFFFVSLAALLVLHNTIESSAFKAASFVQLSLFRFTAPIFVHVAPERLLDVLAVGFFSFAYGRFITYLDSKGRLQINERKERWYGVKVFSIFLPTFGVLSVFSGSLAPLIVGLYLLLIYSFYGALDLWSAADRPDGV